MNRPSSPPDDQARRGYAFGVAAYGLWGVLPLYFKAVAAVSAIDIVVQWSRTVQWANCDIFRIDLGRHRQTMIVRRTE